MRYLSVLLLSPSLAYAACAPGVNYGSLGISSPSPICIAYSGSSLGGCTAHCGGGAGSTVCVELPLDTPPSKGPYFSDGTECKLGGDTGGGDTGGGDTGGGDTGGGDTGGGDNGDGVVGDWAYFNHGGYEDIGRTISELNRNLGKTHFYTASASRAASQIRDTISHVSSNTINMLREDYKTNDILSEALPYIKQTAGQSEGANQYLSRIDGNIHSSVFKLDKIADDIASIVDGGNSGGGGSSSGDIAAIKGMMQTAMGWWGGTPGNLSAINSQLTGISNSLAPMFPMLEHFNKQQTNLQTQMAGDLAAIKDAIKDGAGSGGDGGAGDKPCTGPLCTFSPSGSVPGKGLSDVFGEVAIAGVKQQVTDKQVEIQAQMDEIKGVFSPGKLEVSGTYENDYHDIHGAKIDLSGKSNIELFFSSGASQVIWFLAVLIAFGILMGGRRDA
ncbi:hypothetical protein [Aeromonas caviae]|uniref:hypothetical protein n=1 Tax=Aeromonas caviae TaxID=648 RepID=UPI002B4763C4|nr:hypothetical protein [Aeromonas caviae]